jgi:hypothetical protein
LDQGVPGEDTGQMSVRDSQVTERRYSKLDIRKPRLRLFDKERNEIDALCHNAKIA